MSTGARLALALGGTVLAAYTLRRSVLDAADARALAVREALNRDVPIPPPDAPTTTTVPGLPPRGKRVTRSTTDAHLRVVESPASLLARARRLYPELTLDEYTAARLASSEHASGSFAELSAIIDAEANRAARRGLSIFDHLTGKAGGTYGRQGRTKVGNRLASTRRDPREIHVKAAMSVLRGGRMRGVSQGAEQFFDPRTQLRLWSAGRSCHPLVILRRWAFDYPFARSGGRDSRGRQICPLVTDRPGSRTLAWVGPIAGIDALELMLFRPLALGDEHTRRYRAARQLIESRLLGRRSRPALDS